MSKEELTALSAFRGSKINVSKELKDMYNKVNSIGEIIEHSGNQYYCYKMIFGNNDSCEKKFRKDRSDLLGISTMKVDLNADLINKLDYESAMVLGDIKNRSRLSTLINVGDSVIVNKKFTGLVANIIYELDETNTINVKYRVNIFGDGNDLKVEEFSEQDIMKKVVPKEIYGYKKSYEIFENISGVFRPLVINLNNHTSEKELYLQRIKANRLKKVLATDKLIIDRYGVYIENTLIKWSLFADKKPYINYSDIEELIYGLPQKAEEIIKIAFTLKKALGVYGVINSKEISLEKETKDEKVASNS